VGSEVPAALALPGTEAGHVLLDLRAVIAQRALRAGLSSDHVTLSAHCTRCDDSAFWSHRAGARQRQLGVLGIRAG
jgi:copper oxidase (laccase) domain-containing protein